MPTKRLPARQENLKELLAFISECANDKGFSVETAGRIELVLEEALVNILNYAFTTEEGWVEVHCREMKEPGFIVEICDNGVPFDPLSLPEPDLTLDTPDRRIGGLGIFFMRKMADMIQYSRVKETNVLTLGFTDRKDKN